MPFEIIPAIIPNDFDEITERVGTVLGFTKTIQIDLVDGMYAPNKSWPFNSLQGNDWQNILKEEADMPYWDRVNYEIDLMVNNIPSFWPNVLKMGPKRVVFHLPTSPEKVTELKNFIQDLDPYYKNEIELGIAYGADTNPNDILDIAGDIKFVQCMGIEHVGFQGVSFDEGVFKRIEFVKNNLPNHIISVDGGVNFETIKKLYDAGVTRFICGSVIFNDSKPGIVIDELESTLN